MIERMVADTMTDKQFDALILDSIFDLMHIRDTTNDEKTKELANEMIKRYEIKLRLDTQKFSTNN